VFYSCCVKTSGSYIGVSKRCCPVCTVALNFLSHAKGSSSDKFYIRGSHTTVSGCTLPAFLPRHIRSEIGLLFGARLRVALEGLYNRHTFAKRPTSAESHKIPFGSSFKPNLTRLQTMIKQTWVSGLPGLRNFVTSSSQ
jgi:hypothetical protein